MSLAISCVIPVFNGDRYLGEAIDSALSQRYAPLEVIVVDDGSTDRTAQVAAAFGSRISYHHQANGGAASARNRGVRAAQGELIAILDADDLWHPDKLAIQAERFESRPELDVSLTHMRNFWIPELAEEGETLGQSLPDGVSIQSLVARRRLFDEYGLFDEAARHKDVVGWLALVVGRGAVVETLAQVTVERRIHHTNLSRRRGTEDADELLKLAHTLISSRRRAAESAREA